MEPEEEFIEKDIEDESNLLKKIEELEEKMENTPKEYNSGWSIRISEALMELNELHAFSVKQNGNLRNDLETHGGWNFGLMLEISGIATLMAGGAIFAKLRMNKYGDKLRIMEIPTEFTYNSNSPNWIKCSKNKMMR